MALTIYCAPFAQSATNCNAFADLDMNSAHLNTND